MGIWRADGFDAVLTVFILTYALGCQNVETNLITIIIVVFVKVVVAFAWNGGRD